ncbi:hypothetical protein C3L33_02240, partial [Rhododendron williamsianum]
MSVQPSTTAPIPRIFYSNRPATAFAAGRGHLLVDLVGLCCKSNRSSSGSTRRRLGAASSSQRSLGLASRKNWLEYKLVVPVATGLPPSWVQHSTALTSSVMLSQNPISMVANLEDIISERGAYNDSGDGAGLMTSIPWDLFDNWANKQGIASFDKLHTGVGMVFLPKDDDLTKEAKSGLLYQLPVYRFKFAVEVNTGNVLLCKFCSGFCYPYLVIYTIELPIIIVSVGFLHVFCFLKVERIVTVVIVNIFRQEGLEVLGWRPVPVDTSVVGYYARETMPNIQQVFVRVVAEENVDDIERELYVCRKLIERAANSETWGNELYFCSLSNQTIVYKGMLRSEVLGRFYSDLHNGLYKSPFAIYHRRYSTNTSPRWPLAQPMRLLGHNGEINTIQVPNSVLGYNLPILEFLPFPSIFDAEFCLTISLLLLCSVLIKSGRSPEEALMILVPEAYKNHPTLMIRYPEVIYIWESFLLDFSLSLGCRFYDYYKGQMEAWDGPALLLFSDGKTVGACLDRNGLRPARYWRTIDNVVYVASEVGVLPMDESKVIMKGRLGPGMMITVDLHSGQVYENTEVKKRVASSHPYGKWVNESLRSLKPANFLSATVMENEAILRRQQAYGYSSEDVQMVIENMAAQGKEPTFCMGDDIPLAILSQRSHMLYDYFKQRFAQVTNPAIDPLREGLVMSLEVNIGKRGNILEVGPENVSQVILPSPVLNEGELDLLLKDPYLKPQVLPTFFDIRKGVEGSLEKTLNKLCEAADEAVRNGSQLLVLSDRSDELEPTRPAIPILLAVGAVHQHLIQNGLRMSASIVADTAQCFSTHQFACLIGYGARTSIAKDPYMVHLVVVLLLFPLLILLIKSLHLFVILIMYPYFLYTFSAICPYLALETCRQWRLSTKTVNLMRNGKMPTVTIEQAQKNFCKAVKSGLLKILSKMGISLLSSYCGAQIFEIYGLGKEIVDLAFCGSVSSIGGLTLDEVRDINQNDHLFSSFLVLRDLLEFKSDRPPIPVGKVESALSIVQRFCTGGMSLGAISRETHEAIAIAMNRLGGKSNSGEGGEDPVRWSPLTDVVDGYSPTLPHLKGLQNGDTAQVLSSRSIVVDPLFQTIYALQSHVRFAIKCIISCHVQASFKKKLLHISQVASGRFGVTPTFLVNADQLEIKIAQGAKPGEGGQLPGKKVSAYIARLRNSKPGVPLISPPPHHDIYSIEDLAQLIFDLHQVNPKAKVSVKLVAEAGIGTVASGVAKGNADVIQVLQVT